MNYIIGVILLYGSLVIIDECIEGYINSKLEKEFEIEKRNYYGK